MISYPNSVHCIEEADATIHHQAQYGFSKNLVRYAQKYKTQLFITTHNKEYLTTFLNSIKNSDTDYLINDIRIITLRDYNGIIRYRILDGNDALNSINSGLELRV